MSDNASDLHEAAGSYPVHYHRNPELGRYICWEGDDCEFLVQGIQPDELLPEDHAEIKVVPAAVRDVWTKPEREFTYTAEDYERDRKHRQRQSGD